jgi:hypothetical protein
MRGLRPQFSTQQQAKATQHILSAACPSKCIYCDIWRLATLVASHSPLAARYNLETGTPISSPVSSAPSSPAASPVSPSTPTPYYNIIKTCKKIEAQFQTQRSRLASILSICTVSDADATAGLRLAHDRCAQNIEDLLDQEEELEEELLRDLQEQKSYSHEYSYQPQHPYQKSPTYDSHCHDRRSSMVH